MPAQVTKYFTIKVLMNSGQIIRGFWLSVDDDSQYLKNGCLIIYLERDSDHMAYFPLNNVAMFEKVI